MKNYDEAIRTLELKENEITWGTIKAAYKKRALKTHPDKQTEKNDTQFKAVSESYELLKKIFDQNELEILEESSLEEMTMALSNSSGEIRNFLLNEIFKVSPQLGNYITHEVEYKIAENLSYENASISTSRIHAYTAKAEGNIKDSYKNLKGDMLKTAILADFKESLQNIPVEKAMEKIAEFKQSDEYKILKKSQGIVTWFFNLKTDSVRAFEKISKEAESGAFVDTGGVAQSIKPSGFLGG